MHRLLCVDDEPQVLEGLAVTLGRRYQLETASSGKTALEILRATPDMAVIISDMRMPSMNGAQFLAAARTITPNARRILLTGNADTASAILAVNEGGIFRFLTKPCPSATLIEAVEAAMSEFEDHAREHSAIRRVVIQDLLSHDSVTGLASRETLLSRLEECSGDVQTGDSETKVVLVIEVGSAEESSGGYDWTIAARLLRLLSRKILEAIPGAKCLARYRDMTFAALIMRNGASDTALESLAESLVIDLEKPIDLDGILWQMRVTVGIAPVSATGDPRDALRHAELAAREAKPYVRNTVHLCSEESILKNGRRRETVQALRLAVAEQQMNLHYQPIIDIERDRVYSVEALARWEHPHLGVVSPAVFIPLAEETGLMAALGEWVLNRACLDGRELCGPVFRRVSVNVSVAQILDGRFLYCLHQAIDASGIEPTALELEVTETVFAADLDRVCQLLSEVRSLGVSVAIDDFGAGYSSLAYLARLPVDTLKIDRLFVQDLDRGGEAIINAALSVARTLNIEVIVEGVETALELKRLQALGVTKIQGFFFARPMLATHLPRWHQQFADQRKGA